jgi:hypothetical protein
MASYFERAIEDAGAYYRNLVAGGESAANAAAMADGLLQELLAEERRARRERQAEPERERVLA